MALILEVVDAGSGDVRTRLRIDGSPVTLGRGYGNDLILDDPYVDAQHARITTDDTGALVLEDLGSVNGLVIPDRPQTRRLVLHPGLEVRMGRTLIRFRDSDAPVPAALPDSPESSRRRLTPADWLLGRWGRIAAPVAAIVAVAVYTWLGTYERSSGSNVFGAVMAFLFLCSFYVGTWAIAGRIVVRRFRFLEHLAIASAATLVFMAFNGVNQWVTFLFPDNLVVDYTQTIVGLAIFAALVATHLSLASAMPLRRRWQTGIAAAGILLALAGISALALDDFFNSGPQFSAVLKPFPARWLPAGSVESVGAVAADLKDEVDKIATDKSDSTDSVD